MGLLPEKRLLLLLCTERAEEAYFLRVASEVVGRLEIERKSAEERVVDDAGDGLGAKAALADFRVAVLVRGEAEDAVVEVDGPEPRKAYCPVELGEDTIEVVFDVIASVEDMA